MGATQLQRLRKPPSHLKGLLRAGGIKKGCPPWRATLIRVAMKIGITEIRNLYEICLIHSYYAPVGFLPSDCHLFTA